MVVVDGAKKTYYMGAAGWKAAITRMATQLSDKLGWRTSTRRRPASSPGAAGGRSGGATELSSGGPGSGSWAVNMAAGEPQRSAPGSGRSSGDSGGGPGEAGGPGVADARHLAVRERGGSLGADGAVSSGGEDVVKALKGLWVHVMPGECFGLLGVNGAGECRLTAGCHAGVQTKMGVTGAALSGTEFLVSDLSGRCPILSEDDRQCVHHRPNNYKCLRRLENCLCHLMTRVTSAKALGHGPFDEHLLLSMSTCCCQ